MTRARSKTPVLVAAAFVLTALAAGRAQAADPKWLGDDLPLPLSVRTPQDIGFKSAAERQYLIFNLMAGGKLAFERADYAGAVDKWETLLRMPELDPQVARAVQPFLDDARRKRGHPRRTANRLLRRSRRRQPEKRQPRPHRLKAPRRRSRGRRRRSRNRHGRRRQRPGRRRRLVEAPGRHVAAPGAGDQPDRDPARKDVPAARAGGAGRAPPSSSGTTTASTTTSSPSRSRTSSTAASARRARRT